MSLGGLRALAVCAAIGLVVWVAIIALTIKAVA